jgi:MarR family transcriptional regulator, organic hydroperoxide resistance regulator
MSKQPRRPDDIGRIVNAIRQIRGHLDRYSKELSRSFQITAPQLGVLHVVNRYPETTLSEVSRRMYIHISTVSGIVDRLEIAGYLARRRSVQDRRVVHLILTEKGKRIIAKAPRSALGTVVLNLEKLPAAKLRGISETMQTLLKLMDVNSRAGQPEVDSDANVGK